MKPKNTAVLLAILAAACYGVSAPFSKLLLEKIPPVMMAALLYLGAGAGMLLLKTVRGGKGREAAITVREWPYVAGMIALDIAAPILLMLGLKLTTPATASLMNNFEIVATALIASLLFKEAVGGRMWIAIGLITASSILLSVEDIGGLSVSIGAVLVLLACCCWGLENNCTRMLSLKDPLQIVIIKGFGSGAGSLLIAALTGAMSAEWGYIGLTLLLGFVSYGLSIYFYIHAQRRLGAARTSAYYAFAPFLGVGLSLLVFRQELTVSFCIAFAVMVIGAYFAAFEKHAHAHLHEAAEHDHRHRHDDGHHTHQHTPPVSGAHSHQHAHEAMEHAHQHTPDPHHSHPH